jgi:hypothetical protein
MIIPLRLPNTPLKSHITKHIQQVPRPHIGHPLYRNPRSRPMRDLDIQIVDFHVPVAVEQRREMAQGFSARFLAHRERNGVLGAVRTGVGGVGFLVAWLGISVSAESKERWVSHDCSEAWSVLKEWFGLVGGYDVYDSWAGEGEGPYFVAEFGGE